MEPIDGLEFLKSVQSQYPEALLIVLTGYADQQAFRVLTNELELYSYQGKPWNDHELKRVVRNALDSYNRKKLLSRYVPKEIVEAMLTDDELLRGVELEASVMFLDLRNSTELFHSQTINAQEALMRLNGFFKELLSVIDKYNNAVLDKFTGDGIMVFFGIPTSRSKTPGQDACDAVFAALEMRERVQSLNQERNQFPLTIGIGISTGRVIAGNVGTEDRVNFTVLGNDVNIASRLEKAARPVVNGILISQNTYAYVKDIVNVQEYDPLPAKGNRDSVQVYEVLGTL
jgi:adenylate cyclase